MSGVTEWGIYVELDENKCEGMVPIRDLDDDYYEFDEKNYCLIGRRKKHVYQLGDKLTVQVARADLNKKQLDFAIVGNETDKKAAATSVNKEGDVVSTAKKSKKNPTRERPRRNQRNQNKNDIIRMNITVYLSSKSDLSDNFTNAVSAIGKGIGEMNARLIYGGSNAGQMHILAATAKQHGATVIV